MHQKSCINLWRNRYLGQQCFSYQLDRHRRSVHEKIRFDAPNQHSGHLHGFKILPALSSQIFQPPYPQHFSSPQHDPSLVRQPRCLYHGQIRNVHVCFGHGLRIQRSRSSSKCSMAKNSSRHSSSQKSIGRGLKCQKIKKCGHNVRLSLSDSNVKQQTKHRQLPHRKNVFT